jgi:hypothetical protein
MKTLTKILHKSKWLQEKHYMSLGQINESSDLGRWIRLLASLEQVSTIVEIGTWNGRGSSRMIALGVKDSANQQGKHVQGLEIDFKMWRKAERNLRRYGFFEVIHGTIIHIDDLDTKNLSAVEVQWIAHDQRNLQEAKNVLSHIPSQIDLLILDGGEFSSYAEFLTLESRLSGFVVLDDTSVRKNKVVVEKLLVDKKFKLVWESDLRNGCAIFKRS